MADLTITATSVDWVSGPKGVVDAGETITAGQPIYISSSAGFKADANASATTANAVGIALNGGAIGQPITYAKAGAIVTIGATVAAGTMYVVSATAGGIAPIADLATGWRPNYVGYGIDTTRLQLLMKNSGVAVA